MKPGHSLALALEETSEELCRHVGEYELVAELARGGMGRVFLARRTGQAGFERFYAIKVMHDHLADEPEAVTMLIDEANIASKLHHPNVVSTVDMGIHAGRYYLVMDYVDGPTLSELLRRTKTDRPARLVVPLVIDALRGLHAAHELTDADARSLELIHRDFSPQNILVGVDGTCRVSDFGIAKARARLTRTRPNLQKGKISYMAPEQLVTNDGLDRRVDVWAAGVVLWHALTGVHPFLGPSHAATIHLILERRVPPASAVGFRPPQCFDRICAKALSRDREVRFATAQEMADELQRVAMRQSLLAPHSEISAWIRRVFEKEIEQRSRFLRAYQQKNGDVAWIAPPQVPTLAATPSPIPRPIAPRRDDESRETVHIRVPTRPSSTGDPPPVPPTRAARGTPRPPTVEATDGWLMVLVCVTIGVIVGFTLCIALLASFRQPQTVEPPDPVVLREAPDP